MTVYRAGTFGELEQRLGTEGALTYHPHEGIVTWRLQEAGAHSLREHAKRHHEPVDHIIVKLSPRLTHHVLTTRDKPTHVEGVPLRYVEEPTRGMWDFSMMCQYHSEARDKMVGSMGAIGVFPKDLDTTALIVYP